MTHGDTLALCGGQAVAPSCLANTNPEVAMTVICRRSPRLQLSTLSKDGAPAWGGPRPIHWRP